MFEVLNAENHIRIVERCLRCVPVQRHTFPTHAETSCKRHRSANNFNILNRVNTALFIFCLSLFHRFDRHWNRANRHNAEIRTTEY